jgi:hypothetical protein
LLGITSQMDTTLIDLARAEWDAGRSLEAGRLLYDSLLPQERPAWAAAALELLRPRVRRIRQVDVVLALARDPSRWTEGHRAFQAVRELTLRAEQWASLGRRDPLRYAYLMLAENTAKVIFNATGGLRSFDADCGWWVARCLYDAVELLDDPELRSQAWEVLSTAGRSAARGPVEARGRGRFVLGYGADGTYGHVELVLRLAPEPGRHSITWDVARSDLPADARARIECFLAEYLGNYTTRLWVGLEVVITEVCSDPVRRNEYERAANLAIRDALEGLSLPTPQIFGL